jgi:hypothetical protein
MTVSTLILVLLLTFGAASALDRFVQSHWMREALTRIRLWGRDTGSRSAFIQGTPRSVRRLTKVAI